MSNCASVEEETKESESVAATPPKTVVVKEDDADHHPYAFHVSGPRNVSSPNWRDLINSSWYDSSRSVFLLILFFFFRFFCRFLDNLVLFFGSGLRVCWIILSLWKLNILLDV